MFRPINPACKTQEHQLAAYCTDLVRDLCELTSAIISGNDEAAKNKSSSIMKKIKRQDIKELIGDDLAGNVLQIFIKFADNVEPDSAPTPELNKKSLSVTEFCTALADIFSNIALYVDQSDYEPAIKLLSTLQEYTNTDYFVSLVKEGNALDIRSNLNTLADSLAVKKIDRKELSRTEGLLVRGSLEELCAATSARSPSP